MTVPTLFINTSKTGTAVTETVSGCCTVPPPTPNHFRCTAVKEGGIWMGCTGWKGPPGFLRASPPGVALPRGSSWFLLMICRASSVFPVRGRGGVFQRLAVTHAPSPASTDPNGDTHIEDDSYRLMTVVKSGVGLLSCSDGEQKSHWLKAPLQQVWISVT